MESTGNENIDSEHPLYVIYNNRDGYIIAESNEYKNLIFASTKNYKKVLRKYKELWDKMKYHMDTVNDGESIKYKKDFMKISFDSNDDLRLGKILSILLLIIVLNLFFSSKRQQVLSKRLSTLMWV